MTDSTEDLHTLISTSDHSDPIADLVAALSELTSPARNGHDLDAACRPVLAAHGWVWMQDVTTSPGTVHINTRLLHTTGHTIDHGPLNIPCPRGGPQDIATCATYGRRIQLAAILGLPAGTDNDASDQTPGRATDSQKNHIWELATQIWPDHDPDARREALAAEVATICDGATLTHLQDTQAVMIITQLTAALNQPEPETPHEPQDVGGDIT